MCDDRLKFNVIWAVTVVQTTSQIRRACKPVCCSLTGHFSDSTKALPPRHGLDPASSSSNSHKRPFYGLTYFAVFNDVSVRHYTGPLFFPTNTICHFQTICVAGSAQGMPPLHFAVTRGPRYLFQCIPGYKNFSVILFILRSFSKVLDYCIEDNISLLITIFKGAGNYCLPILNTRHFCL